MKRLAAVLVAGALLTGCAAQTPEPVKTPTMTLQECATEAFKVIKDKHGVQFLVDHKDEANAMVLEACKGLPSK